MDNQELYRKVTDQILDLMKTEGCNWTRPWTSSFKSYPINVTTGNRYQGINVLMLGMETMLQGWARPYFATEKQWARISGKLLPDAKPTPIVFYQGAMQKANAVFRVHWLYNAEQVTGIVITEPEITEQNSDERLATVDTFVQNTGAVVKVGYNRASYFPTFDEIRMPDFEQFQSAVAYYGTQLHELVHWTGNKKRLDRIKHSRFGDEAYAFEELVAELGSALMSAEFGVTMTPRTDHAKYLNAWIKRLEADPKLIFQASAKAQKAVNFLKDAVTANSSTEQVA